MDNAYEIVERQHSGSINGGAYNKKSNVVPQRMKGPGLERRPSLFQVFGGKEEVTKRKRKMTGLFAFPFDWYFFLAVNSMNGNHCWPAI